MWISAQLYVREKPIKTMCCLFFCLFVGYLMISFCHSENPSYLNVGAVFGKCLISFSPLSTVVGGCHARFLDTDFMRFILHGLLAW